MLTFAFFGAPITLKHVNYITEPFVFLAAKKRYQRADLI